MRGKEEERELVLDANQISFEDIQLLESLLQEMGGAVNIWLSPQGTPTLCHDHAEDGARLILKKPLAQQTGPDYWASRGKVYQTLFRRGWMRVAVKHQERLMMVEYSGKTTEEQWLWLYEKADKDQLAITDDRGKIILDYRQGSPQQESQVVCEIGLDPAKPEKADFDHAEKPEPFAGLPFPANTDDLNRFLKGRRKKRLARPVL
jgi:hypothetical protein